MPELGRRDLLKTAGVVGGAALAGLHWPLSARAQTRPALDSATVFERGQNGYHTFRTPTVVRANDGTLLAFAGGRVNDAEDFGHIDTVLKRSFDGGRTWAPLQVAAADPPNRVSNQVAVVDRNTGRIHLYVVRTGGDVTGSDIVDGTVSPEDAPRPFVLHSDDHGATWSDPVEITDAVKLPDMRHYVGGPGHGIQLVHAPRPGRLILPGNHNVLPAQDGNPPVVGVHVTYSDDGGETWHLGAIDRQDDGLVNPNETTVVELEDGTLYFGTRSQRGTEPGNRAFTTSSDGGDSFDAPFRMEPDLVAPICHASLYKVDRPSDQGERVVFSAPHHPSSRERLTLWSSLDGGGSWEEGLQVYDGPSGYSDLVDVDGPGSTSVLGVLFENGPRLSDERPLTYHQRLTFTRVPLHAVDDPPCRPSMTPDLSGNGNHAVVSGSPEHVRGVRGGALELAGHYVEVPLNDSIDLGEQAFTAALWFRTSDQRQQRIVHAYNYSGYPQWRIEIVPQSSALRAQLRTDAGSGTAAAGGNYADGQWHHVAVRWGGQHVWTLYLDGDPVASHPAIPGSVSAGALAGIRFGARLDGINHPFVGAIDEIYLFSRGLAHSEVASLAAQEPFEDGHTLFHLPLDDVL